MSTGTEVVVRGSGRRRSCGRQVGQPDLSTGSDASGVVALDWSQLFVHSIPGASPGRRMLLVGQRWALDLPDFCQTTTTAPGSCCAEGRPTAHYLRLALI